MSNLRANELTKWGKFLNQIFNNNIPEHHEWTNLQEIIKILDILGTSDVSNYTFFPNGGGLDLCGAKISKEPGCIEVNFDGCIHILKPQRLIFESFLHEDSEWFHFRIVTDNLQPSGIYLNSPIYQEEVVEINPYPQGYIDSAAWQCNEYNGKQLPKRARILTRILSGELAVFSKASRYNQNHLTADVRHHRIGQVGFRNYVRRIIELSN